MAGSLQSRVKTWVSGEDVVYSDLNAEFDNVLQAMQPLLMDDYSTNTAQMQVQTDPGEVGTESLATTLAGELARIRFMLAELSGETNWYESPPASLNDLVNAVGTGLLDNRIASGRTRSGSEFPAFLVPDGTARTIKVDGAPTPFVYYIDGIQYTISTDVTLTGLTAAPASNNTCLVNDGNASSQEWTKYAGENGTEIPVDNMGSEITGLVGKFAAFKIGTEYFIAFVKSTTVLSKVLRGYFFDSTDVPFPRVAYADNATITLQKLTWIFARADGTITATYTNPTWSDDEPVSPAQGDYWFDTSAGTWKRFDVSSFISATATLVGVCIQTTSATIGARSYEFFRSWDPLNTVEVFPESNSQVKSRYPGAEISVWGNTYRFERNLITWDMTLDLDSGVTEASGTTYYFYLTETGDKIISNIRPYDRNEDLRGWYHPHQSWRCVGFAYNNGSSNLIDIESYFRRYPSVTWLTPQTATSEIEVVDQVIPLDTSGGAITKYLPFAATCRGQSYTFVKTNSALNAATISTLNSEVFNGGSATSLILVKQGDSVTVKSNGTGFYIVSQYLTPYVISATSSVKTPGATDNYHALTGNSINLFQGTWKLFGSGLFDNSGSTPTYSEVILVWAAANGNDTNTVPAALSTASGITILESSVSFVYPGVRTNSARIPSLDHLITLTAAPTLYLDSYATMSTAGNARITVYANAERVGLL